MALQRISSLDLGYSTGQLSLFPTALDSPYQLYQATNNATTTLKQTLTYSGKYIVVDDTSTFPPSGLIRIGPPPGEPGNYELVYYDQLTTGVFRNLIRGFAGSRQGQWTVGSWITNSVMAEHHNAIKDSVMQMQFDLGLDGTVTQPSETSLNGILQSQELRFLSPQALFRAFPQSGPPALRVRFQNFSTGPVIRSLWDFGDGTTSVERSPTHTYLTEGSYTVSLNIITLLGAQGIVTKNNYVTVNAEDTKPFFYVSPQTGLSRQTAAQRNVPPTVFNFVDQTDGSIAQRYWIFGGNGTINNVEVENQSVAINDPNVHTTSFVYDLPGNYEPSLLVLFSNQDLQRAYLTSSITVQ